VPCLSYPHSASEAPSNCAATPAVNE
jgi:hypothetical protein